MKPLKNTINPMGLTLNSFWLLLLVLCVFEPTCLRGEEIKRATTERRVLLKKVEETSVQELIGPYRQPTKDKASFDLKGFKARYETSKKTWPSKDSHAKLRLSLAAELDKKANASGDVTLLEASAWTYQDIIASTTGMPKLRASCNRTAQLLRQGKTKEAITTMEQVNPMLQDASLSANARARSLYNYGRALQMDNRAAEAFQVLKQAADVDPTFRKAAQAAGEAALVYDDTSSGILAMVKLSSEQLAHLNYQGAATNLRAAIGKATWRGDENYPRLLGQLAHYFASAEIDTAAFKRDWLNDLVAIERDGRLNKTSLTIIRDLRRIYNGRIKVQLSPRQVRSQYQAWHWGADDFDRHSGHACLSDFLHMVGNGYYRQKNLSRALACYGQAWALNSKNMETGLYLANILLLAQQPDHQFLDPKGQILEAFIDQLFLGKGNEYRRDVGTDWEKILKCHVILARVFERQKKWGPPHDARTALFQWTLAGQALERLSQEMSPEDRTRFGQLVESGIKKAARQWNDH